MTDGVVLCSEPLSSVDISVKVGSYCGAFGDFDAISPEFYAGRFGVGDCVNVYVNVCGSNRCY